MTRDASDILPRTAVVIPAFNAGRHLASVLGDVRGFLPPERVIVVNDGSTDDTAGAAARAGVVVCHHAVNRGKGAALRTGLAKAIELGMEYVITLDADGQHDPSEITRFVDAAARTGADVLVGNRMADRRTMPFIRVFANAVTSWFVSLKAGQRVPDSQNGYRMLRTALAGSLRLETERYDTESEILIKAARAGGKIESVPVRTIYGSEKSAVNPVIDTVRFFRLVLKSLFW